MSETEKKIAVAKACGWKRVRNDGEGNYTLDETGPLWRSPSGRIVGHINNDPAFPDWPDDANTRPEMLVAMTNEEKYQLAKLFAPGPSYDYDTDTVIDCIGMGQSDFFELFGKTKGLW